MNDYLYGNSAVGASEGTRVYEDEKEIAAIFGRSNMLLVMYPNTSMVTEKHCPGSLRIFLCKSVTSMANTLPEGIPEEFLPYSLTNELHRGDKGRMLVYIRTKTESREAFQDTGRLKKL